MLFLFPVSCISGCSGCLDDGCMHENKEFLVYNSYKSESEHGHEHDFGTRMNESMNIDHCYPDSKTPTN